MSRTITTTTLKMGMNRTGIVQEYHHRTYASTRTPFVTTEIHKKCRRNQSQLQLSKRISSVGAGSCLRKSTLNHQHKQHKDYHGASYEALHICRAEPRRIARLEKQFAREMSALLCYDEVLLNAMSPYREYTYDDEDLLMAEVTEVVLSNDLQVAKVYVYFSGDDTDARMFAFDNLKRKVGYIRKELSQKVKMRRAPEVRLIYDKSIEEQEKLDEIFEKLRNEREASQQSSSSQEESREIRTSDVTSAASTSHAQDNDNKLDNNDREFLSNQAFYIGQHDEDDDDDENADMED